MPKKKPKSSLLEEMNNAAESFNSLGLNNSMLAAAKMASSFDTLSEQIRKASSDLFHPEIEYGFDSLKLAANQAEEIRRLATGPSIDTPSGLVASFGSSTQALAEEMAQSFRDMQDLITPRFDAASFAQQYADGMSGFDRFVEESWAAQQEMMRSFNAASLGAFENATAENSEISRIRDMLELHDWQQEALAAARSLEIVEQRATDFEIEKASAYITEQVSRAIRITDKSLLAEESTHPQTGVQDLVQMVASLQHSIEDLKQSRFSKAVDYLIGAVIQAVISMLFVTIMAILSSSCQQQAHQPARDHRMMLKAAKSSLRESNEDLRPIRVVKVKNMLRVHQGPNINSRTVHHLPPLAAVVVKDTKGKMALIFHRNPMTAEVIAGWVAKKYLAKIY